MSLADRWYRQLASGTVSTCISSVLLVCYFIFKLWGTPTTLFNRTNTNEAWFSIDIPSKQLVVVNGFR